MVNKLEEKIGKKQKKNIKDTWRQGFYKQNVLKSSYHNKREKIIKTNVSVFGQFCCNGALELGKASQICFEEAVMAHVGLKAF